MYVLNILAIILFSKLLKQYSSVREETGFHGHVNQQVKITVPYLEFYMEMETES